MTTHDIAKIESHLNCRLPADLESFLGKTRDQFDPDDVSVVDDADTIIAQTEKFRAGFSGLSPWPESWIYLGDESDACPYYIDCLSGKFVQLDKGDRDRSPLHYYETFAEFLASHRQDAVKDAELDQEPLTWKDTFRFYLPAAITLFLFFFGMPLIGIALKFISGFLFK